MDPDPPDDLSIFRMISNCDSMKETEALREDQ
jgi:hypothetical protein